MKLTYQEAGGRRPRDERTTQVTMDDALTAAAVRGAPTPEEAWARLGVPVPFDPAQRDRLTGALERVLAHSEAIVKGLTAFRALAPDAEVPPAWVDRMVELHVAELEAYWALDAEAVAGALSGGWTTGEAERFVADPAERVRQRARWQAAAVKPAGPALWFDKLVRALDAAGDPEAAGRDLVAEATRRHFADWRRTRVRTR